MDEDEIPDGGQEPLRPPGEGMYDRFARLTGVSPEAAKAMWDATRGFNGYAAVPPELVAMGEALAQAQELGQIDMSMQVTALHSYFDLLTTPPGPDRFTESQALYYLAKLTPGL